VVPADAGRSSAAGSNRWLSLGATALLNPDDLIKTVGIGPLKPSRASKTQAEQLALTGREALLLAAIGAGASMEQLCRRLRQEPQQLSERLLKLELEGVIKSEPGLWWRPGAAASL
jgi:DNA processing protein